MGMLKKQFINFTSMAEPSQRADVTNIESDGEFQDERELEKEVYVHQSDDELHILDQVVTAERKDDEDEQVNQTSGVGGAKPKPNKILKKPKRSPKKSSGDALVGVMQRFVDIKEKESKKEDAVDFSITRCMQELRTLEGVTPHVKVRCYDIFKCAKNCEIFINAVAEKDGTALAWLQSQIVLDQEIPEDAQYKTSFMFLLVWQSFILSKTKTTTATLTFMN